MLQNNQKCLVILDILDKTNHFGPVRIVEVKDNYCLIQNSDIKWDRNTGYPIDRIGSISSKTLLNFNAKAIELNPKIESMLLLANQYEQLDSVLENIKECLSCENTERNQFTIDRLNRTVQKISKVLELANEIEQILNKE